MSIILIPASDSPVCRDLTTGLTGADCTVIRAGPDHLTTAALRSLGADLIVFELTHPRLNVMATIHRIHQDPQLRMRQAVLGECRNCLQAARDLGADLAINHPCNPANTLMVIRVLLSLTGLHRVSCQTGS